MLQTKALGCIDENENKELQEFIDAGHLFPWDELGKFQNIASLLPLALELELPDSELKDRVALKLIKLSEQLRTSKIIEEDKFEIEEDVEELVNDYTNIDEPFVEPPIEIETEETTIVKDNLLTELAPDEITFNLDEVKLHGFDESEVSENNLNENAEIESPFETLIDESQIEYPKVDEVVLPSFAESEISEHILQEDEIIESPFETLVDESQIEYPIADEAAANYDLPTKGTPETIVNEISLNEESTVTKIVEDSEDASKQIDFNKRSVAEKMFKAIEQDFDSLKFQYEVSERKITRGLLIAYIVIAILLATLVFSFFKFSSDINGLNNDIKNLKQKTSSSLYYEHKTSFIHTFYS
ncbi:MAG: hypothetical protein IPJ23_00910 [Ignavibacteriales bacterium]|nr:hypothetical protein [Ignavibacteriales bacterium]